MIPIDIILVRHGESEGNKANKASRDGDKQFFTPEFRNKHSRAFRLTDRGIEQAKMAGDWLRSNIEMSLDRFYVSDYIRAKETAAYLDLPDASWRIEFHLRERDMALMDNCPDDEKKQLFTIEQRQFNMDPFLAYPAGGGESIADLCQRLKTTMIAHWARECSDKRVIAVCHGHVMRALQLEFEDLGHDDFIRLDASEKPEEKIRNCQILWYTRREPETKKLFPNLIAVRSVSPTEKNMDFGWKKIKKNRYTNEDLLNEVDKYHRHIS
ncbi:MAG: phosphoglycerate mutase family protein [bacterium]|nr:phosphoglycerate mutase family protein [bacterium]